MRINLDVSEGTLYVYEDTEGIVGCVTLNTMQASEYTSVSWRYCEEPVGVIHRLMVNPKVHGRGIAKLLMSFVEKTAIELGYCSIRLDAFSKNPTALGFYENMAYESVGSVQFRKGKFICFEKVLV